MNEHLPYIIEHYDGSKLSTVQRLGKKVVAKFSGVRLIDTSTAAFAESRAAWLNETDVRHSAGQAAHDPQVSEPVVHPVQRSISPEKS